MSKKEIKIVVVHKIIVAKNFKKIADKYNVLINDKLKTSKPKFDPVMQPEEYTEELNRMLQNDDEFDYDLTMELGEMMNHDTSLKENENKYFKLLKRKKRYIDPYTQKIYQKRMTHI